MQWLSLLCAGLHICSSLTMQGGELVASSLPIWATSSNSDPERLAEVQAQVTASPHGSFCSCPGVPPSPIALPVINYTITIIENKQGCFPLVLRNSEINHSIIPSKWKVSFSERIPKSIAPACEQEHCNSLCDCKQKRNNCLMQWKADLEVPLVDKHCSIRELPFLPRTGKLLLPFYSLR